MVCIKQVSIPAVVLLSLAEQAVAAPVALRGDIVARDAAQTADAIELVIRDLELHERGKLLTKVLTPIVKATKKPGKVFDRLLSTANTGMAIANTHKTQTGKRDLEELDQRDIEEEIILALRDLGLDERSLIDIAKKGAKAIGSVVKKNKGKTFDRLLSTANTGMAIANTHKTQTGKRDLEELDQRDIEEEIILALRDLGLDERSLIDIAKKGAKAIGSVVMKNKGKTFDRTLSTANTAMTVANTNKALKGKRGLNEIEERDLQKVLERDIEKEITLALRDLGLDERSIFDVAKKGIKAVGSVIMKNKGKTFDRTLSTANTAMTVANTNKALKGKRDLEDIEERDWEDVEERDVEELEERDWEDVEERDIDDLEARAIGQSLGKLAKGVVKGVGHVINSVSKQQGLAYNRANAAANSAMKVAQTKKKQEKRDFEERDFEYLNSLSQRDLEDLELVVRALYSDYLEDY
ncbi:unnamed protein product [Clonostachys chloroleuca]|uniref:Uncharacterized protein n=1 Tax=Clonostachys chloroleuca TaxID=1926264 RepID=A0AA35PXF6_9HYPO|nr:unnamed protein product [Clonostachys chloroleuca]